MDETMRLTVDWGRCRWSDWWQLRRADAAAGGVIILFFVMFFPQAVFGGKFLIAGDAYAYSYPMRSIAWEMIRNGQLPLWTPHVLSGYPLLAMAQLAIGYPLTWGYLFLPGYWAEQIYVLAPFLLSPIFTYAYAREVGRSRLAALLAGLAFGYGGMMCSGISNSGMLTNSMLWLPLFLIPIDRAARRDRFIPCLLAATFAYTMAVLNGHGQSFVYIGTLAAVYGLFLSAFPAGRKARARRALSTQSGAPLRWLAPQRWRPLFVAVGAIGLSGGVAAFQLLETMQAARYSTRRALSYETLGEGSFKLGQAAKSLVAPFYYFVDVATYMPPLVFLLALIACVAAWRRRKGGDARVFFWLGVAVVSWVLMLGINTPVHHVVFRVPFLNQFRVPSRHALEWTFALSVLAAYGWDALAPIMRECRRRLPLRPRREEIVFSLLALASAVVVALLWRRAALEPALPGGKYYYTNLAESSYLLWKACFVLLVSAALWRGWLMAASRWRTLILSAAIVLTCYAEPHAIISAWWGGLGFSAERFAVVSPATRYLQIFAPEANRVYTRVGLFEEDYTRVPRLEGVNQTARWGLHNVAGMEPLIFDRYSRALGGVGPDSVTPRAGYAPNDDLFQPPSRVLDLLNTNFLVAFSNLTMYHRQIVSKEGIRFSPAGTQLIVPPEQTVMLRGVSDEGDALAFVSALANSVEVEQGTAVAKVSIYISGAPVIERILRAGVDTAEWAHERADVRAVIRHSLAPVFDTRGGDESNNFPAHRYLARIPLGTRARVDKIEITNLTGNVSLTLSAASLYNSANESSTPLMLASLEWWETVYQQNDTLILRNRRALPRAWLVSQAEAVDGEEALRRIRGESVAAFDPRRTALMEVAPADLPALTPVDELAPESEARITSYEPNRLVIETRAAQASVLVVSEIFYPGWEATIDGAVAPIHPTNFLLRGVALPAGAHRVEMRYTAPAARIGAIISALSLLALIALNLSARRNAKKEKKD